MGALKAEAIADERMPCRYYIDIALRRPDIRAEWSEVEEKLDEVERWLIERSIPSKHNGHTYVAMMNRNLAFEFKLRFG